MTDPLGATSSHVYDERGDLTALTLGHVHWVEIYATGASVLG